MATRAVQSSRRNEYPIALTGGSENRYVSHWVDRVFTASHSGAVRLTGLPATAIRTASTTLTSGTPTLSSALLGASTRCRFPPHTQVRALWGGLFGSKTKSEPNKPATTSVESHQNRKELVEQMKKSSMAKDSIFSDELGGEKAAKGAAPPLDELVLTYLVELD